MNNQRNPDLKRTISEITKIFIMLYKTRKNFFAIIQGLLSFLMINYLITNSFAQQAGAKDEAIVQKFYLLNHQPLFWFSSDKNIHRATEWLTMMESANQLGIVSNKQQSDQIRVALLSNSTIDNTYKEQRDRQITGLVLNFIKELQIGNIKFDYDEVSITRDSVYIHQLMNLDPRESVSTDSCPSRL